MAKFYEQLSEELQDFISKQKIYFTATAAETGTINLSPKGLDSLYIKNPKTVIWQNLTGSGNETAAHLLLNNRMTVMFCSFEGKPLILRLYGTALAIHPRDEKFQEYRQLFKENIGTRQFIELSINRVQTSCGFAVPLMDFRSERDTLSKWTDAKGQEGIHAYWEQKNRTSIDGFDTEIFGPE